jgi:hypothetical protein
MADRPRGGPRTPRSAVTGEYERAQRREQERAERREVDARRNERLSRVAFSFEPERDPNKLARSGLEPVCSRRAERHDAERMPTGINSNPPIATSQLAGWTSATCNTAAISSSTEAAQYQRFRVTRIPSGYDRRRIP